MNTGKNFINISLLNDDYRRPKIVKLIKQFIGLRFRERISRLVKRDGYIIKSDMREKNVIFVHIPKAAGTSISSSLYGRRTGHFPAMAYKSVDPEFFNGCYKFSFVRDPMSRLYSAWRYLQKSPHTEDRKWFEENLSIYSDFEQFIVGWLSDENIMKWKHFVPQYLYLYDGDELLVDDVFMVEDMDASVKEISRKLGSPLSVNHENKVDGKKEIDVSDRATNIVREVYSEDYSRLNYV